MYPKVRISLVYSYSICISSRSPVASIGVGVCPEFTSGLRWLTLMTGHVLTVSLAGVLHRTEAVCPVHRHVQLNRISLVHQRTYVRLIGMDVCILKEDEIGLDHGKFVPLIGINVYHVSSGLRG